MTTQTQSMETMMKEITDTQIEILRTEAGQAGDGHQVALCDLALDGDEQARGFCAEAIETAEAMRDDESTVDLYGEQDGIVIYVTEDGDIVDELAPSERGVKIIGHRWYPCSLDEAQRLIRDEYLAGQ